MLRFPDLSHLIHTTPLWDVNGRDALSHFIEEKTEVRRGGSFSRGHPGRKGIRGSSWIPARMGSGVRRRGVKSLFKAKRIQETGGHLRRGRQAPVSQFTSPPFPFPCIALPPARRALGTQAKPAAFQEGRHGVRPHSPNLLSFSLKFHTPRAFGRSPECASSEQFVFHGAFASITPLFLSPFQDH